MTNDTDREQSQKAGVSSQEGGVLQEFSPEQTLVNQHLQRLDEVSRRMEAKWGVDRLQRCVSPELLEKWTRQWAKFNAAVDGFRHADTVDLAQGCVRAWEALEKGAMASGYQPDVGVALEARMPSGAVLRVCASAIDARRPTPEGYVVYSMEEVARILDKMQLVNQPKDQSVEAGETRKRFPESFWKDGGEAIPF